ncbi:hypothetical protein [Bradyrhizobium sp. URHC0002]
MNTLPLSADSDLTDSQSVPGPMTQPACPADVEGTSDEELESLIRRDYERCHPGDTLDDLKRRAAFSKEDRGLLRDWMATAAAYRKRCRD